MYVSTASVKSGLLMVQTGSWCGIAQTRSWIQVDFGQTVDLYALILQNRYQSVDRVFYFDLTYSNDGNTWTVMKYDDGTKKVTIKCIIAFCVVCFKCKKNALDVGYWYLPMFPFRPDQGGNVKFI